MKSIIFFVVLGLFVCLMGYKVFYSYTPSIKPAKGEASISILENVLIGGVKQCLCIRGNNINKPVLLVVHGGPGDAAMPILNSLNRILEQDFIVVNWDQRGAGKSFCKFKKDSDISIDTFVCDIHETASYLLERFGKEKIYILGHSWGSVLSMKAVQRHPELFYAYIGVGQVVDMDANEKLSYDFTLQESIKRGDKTSEEALLKKDSADNIGADWMAQLLTQRKLLLQYGGALWGQESYWSLEKHFLHSPEYTLIDIVNRVRGSKQSIEYLWPELTKVNFPKTATRIEIPVFFFQGKHDYNTPSSLLVKYFEILDAPQKELIWFDESAHFPQWEEPEKFHASLKTIVSEKIRNP
jgi:pimeloyl-ACP methyl ester carboxylesterase